MKCVCSFLLLAFLTSDVGLAQVIKNPFRKPGSDRLVTGTVIPGAYRTDIYVPYLKGSKIGLVINQSSMIGAIPLADSLIKLGLNITTLFSPEHGISGKAEAGEHVQNAIDEKTKLPIISLYGDHKEPTKADLENVDILIFDIQDVGVRFYTYISTLHYIMRASAKYGKNLVILDRPNPNGHYVDGPILETEYKSFVGIYPIPVVHGLTIGEMAQMANGEHWLDSVPGENLYCQMTVVPCANYSHQSKYILPVHPSPNLRNQSAIYLYPSLCFFEGTPISVGRGTDYPFQQFGNPSLANQPDSFVLKSNLKKQYHGYVLTSLTEDSLFHLSSINLDWLIQAYKNYPIKSKFFTPFFTSLAGTTELQKQIVAGYSAEQIKKTWIPGINDFYLKRKKYLLYPE